MRKLLCLPIALFLSLLSGLATAQTASNVVCGGCVHAGDIATGAVTTIDLANGNVTSDKIADGTIKVVDLANNNVTSAKITNGTVQFVDLSSEVVAFLGGAIANISVIGTATAAEGVVGASCPSDRIPVSASCSCDSANSTRNFGVLFSCRVSGNGAVAACFEDALTFDPFLPAPLAIVTPGCLGATSVDGTPWLPMSTGLATDRTDSQASKMMSSDAETEWHKAQQDAYETALSELKTQRAIRSSRLPRQQR